jgi:pimeloyl-ACP methyl ester carboxylesterase
VVANRLRSIVEVDVTRELDEIEIPLLYLVASEDRLVPASAGKLFRRPERNWQVTKVTGPHLLVQSAPREVLTAVRIFLESL